MNFTYKSETLLLASLLLFLLSFTTSNAQEKELELEKIKVAALKYSKTIKNDSLKVVRATLVKKEAFDNYFPEVSASGFALYGFDYLVPEIPTYLPDGIDNVYSIGVTATEPIYAGGKIRIGNELADLQLDAQKISHGTSIDSVMLNAELKFWQLIQIQEKQKVVKSGKAYLNELLKQQEDLLEAGLISESQMLQVKVEKSGVLLNELELSNLRKIALLDLSLYVGIPFDTTMVAKKQSYDDILASAFKYNTPQVDLPSNKLYQLSEKQVSAASLQIKNEKADLLPQVAVGVSASHVSSFNNQFDGVTQPIAFGTVTIPISAFWGKEKKQIKQREVDLKIAENNFDDTKNQLTKYIMKNWYDLQSAFKQIQYAQDKVAYATENLKSQRDNYNSGLSNLTDLLSARQTKEEADADLVSAFANYKEKEATYLYSINQIEVPVNLNE
ncbi:TolC family protein [Cellulophaga baltica]|uniref:TolC family protein n=1 Tax=Cellulophaga TaxID=104264 RepID=UPI001C07DA72|nr:MULTISPECIES: TolC family protein [Cellulophaga]MBU2996792.1 TolC family protein [Cellulophaga baltica]MDO6768188.1 TolC family protein [Cellulophaga sp. 1_MG-2023]